MATTAHIYLCRDKGGVRAALGPNAESGGTCIKIHPWLVREMIQGWLLAHDTEEAPPLTGWYLCHHDSRDVMLA